MVKKQSVDAAERARKLAERAAPVEDMRRLYESVVPVLEAEGWTDCDLADFAVVIKADRLAGDGAEREAGGKPLVIPRDERMALWSDWMRRKVGSNPAAGINDRLRAQAAA